jgi:hypothetical protein
MISALPLVLLLAGPAAAEMPRLRVSDDGKGFALATGKPFVPFGFNYDHDPKGRLIEDYWDAEWPRVEADFAEMRRLGGTVVRVHLQFGMFMDAPDKPNAAALARLGKLLALAEKEGLYLDLTGLGCYHKADVPAWYDALDERARWDAQAAFWAAVAGRCKPSPAILCYDLMNEPVVPGGKRKPGDWLAGAFGGKHFVQFVTLDQRDRPRPAVARAWVKHLAAAVRRADPGRLVTVGLVDWSLERPGLTSGFVPTEVAPELDFLAVHIYPEKGKIDAAVETLKGFAAAGKPVVVEETFPLKCSPAEMEAFMDKAGPLASGWVSFYWGKPPAELRKSKEFAEVLTLDWLERYCKRSPGR